MPIIARYLIPQFLVCYTGPAQCLLLIQRKRAGTKTAILSPAGRILQVHSSPQTAAWDVERTVEVAGPNTHGQWA
jgi:hypothetical protein